MSTIQRHFTRITDPEFRYYSSVDTNLRRTFERVRQKMEKLRSGPADLRGSVQAPKSRIKETA